MNHEVRSNPARRKPRGKTGRAVVLGSLIGLAACSVVPDYTGSGLLLPARFTEARVSGDQRSDLSKWWRTFRDPVLNDLIEAAVAGNLDVAAATAKIRAARATQRAEVGGLAPTLDGSSSATRTQVTGTGGDRVNWQFRAGFDTAWELDLFGGKRRSVEAAGRTVEATEADLKSVLLTLVGDVATNYIEVRGTQARIALAERTAASQRETRDLTKVKFDAGSSSALDLANATAVARSTMAVVPQLEQSRAQSVHRLGLLLGREPGALVTLLAPPKPIPMLRLTLRPGVPADLLSRRPDIAAAERRLAAATAQIGVADAALYPSVSLTGSLSTSATRIGDLGKGTTIGWSWGPSLTVPIFSGGKLAAAVDLAGAERDQAHITLQSTVLTAMEDVENALVALAQERVRAGHLDASAAAYRQSVSLSRTRWQAGSSPFLDVLDAQRSLYSAEDSLLQSRTAIAVNAVALAKALGGGWDDPVPVDVPRLRDTNTGSHLMVSQ